MSKLQSIFSVGVMMLVFGTTGVGAQDTVSVAEKKKPNIDFTVQGDLVSSYIWRGMYQSGAAFQPTLGFSVGGFSLTAWGSVDFTGQGHKEADITASYKVKDFTFSVADLWCAGESGIYNDNVNGENHYFNFDNHTTNHVIELGASYTLPVEKFPLCLSWYTAVWGADKKLDDAGEVKQAFSSYLEAAYPFSVKTVDLVATVGAVPWESVYNDRFAITNISLKATKVLHITDRFNLPIFAQAIWNPNREDVHFVLGITLK